MPNYQRNTTYNDSDDVFRGSAAVSVAAWGSSPTYAQVGAQVGLTITRETQIAKEEVDDAQDTSRIYKDEFLIKFNRYEILKDPINQVLYEGTDTRNSTAAGAAVPASPANDQVIAAGDTINLRPVPLNLGNDDGTVPTLTSVTASVSGVLAANDDYFLIPAKSGNNWEIYFDESGTATVALATETITIVWGSLDQTASITWLMGAGTELNDLSFKIIANNDGRIVTYTAFKCELEANGDMVFAKDDAEERRNPEELTFRARPDYTYHSDGSGGAYAMSKVINAAS